MDQIKCERRIGEERPTQTGKQAQLPEQRARKHARERAKRESSREERRAWGAQRRVGERAALKICQVRSSVHMKRAPEGRPSPSFLLALVLSVLRSLVLSSLLLPSSCSSSLPFPPSFLSVCSFSLSLLLAGLLFTLQDPLAGPFFFFFLPWRSIHSIHLSIPPSLHPSTAIPLYFNRSKRLVSISLLSTLSHQTNLRPSRPE